MFRIQSLALAAFLGSQGAVVVALPTCAPAYENGGSYVTGSQVSNGGINYQCCEGANSAYCGMAGYEPGSQYGGTAWIELGPCTGSSTNPPPTPPTPHTVPTPPPIMVAPPWTGGGCPSAYVPDADYSTGDVVSVDVPGDGYTTVYECVSGANSLFCDQASFAPGTTLYFSLAWTYLGSCAGSLAPTDAPYSSLPDVGGCPAPYTKSGDAYMEGDQVSYQGFVYECKAWPQSLHCSQAGYEPGVNPASATPDAWKDAWTLIGSCSGTIEPTTSPVYHSLPDLGGCPGPWIGQIQSGNPYEEGDMVSDGSLVYKCKAWPLSGHCAQAGYEPNTNPAAPDAWKMAWSVEGHCSGTITPTSSPDFVSLPYLGGCPGPWIGQIQSGQPYEEGDLCSDGKLVYECKAWPYSGHCAQAGYEPDTNPATPDAWKDAWKVVGYCSGSISPTTSPDIANDIGACPDEWESGSHVSYEEGDMVSVTVSDVPLRQVAYRCKAYPYSGFCGQFSPTEFGGDQGWEFVGSCSGDTTPTQSPSFDALSDVGGCPEPWDPTDDTYEAGDLVSYAVSDAPARKIVFKCREWPDTGYCNQGAGFEPTTLYAAMAWDLVGSCDNSMAPTGSPAVFAGVCTYVKDTYQPCTSGSALCSCPAAPPPCTELVPEVRNIEPWDSSTAYEVGDVVRVGAKRFRCKALALWCQMVTHKPTNTMGGIWEQAWMYEGMC